jgi:hypothetical protein
MIVAIEAPYIPYFGIKIKFSEILMRALVPVIIGKYLVFLK